MNQDGILLESLDALVKLVDIVQKDSELSFAEIEPILLEQYKEGSVIMAMNYYLIKVVNLRQERDLFLSDEYSKYGNDINDLIVFLLSNNLVSYSKVEEIIERLSILSFAVSVHLIDVKRLLSVVMFAPIKPKIKSFLVN